MASRLWTPQQEGFVLCNACAQACRIGSGKLGQCCVRGNKRGALYTLTEDMCGGVSLDPIERHGLRHFLPGTTVAAVQGLGCSLSCSFCPNADVALGPRDRQMLRGQRVDMGLLVRKVEARGASTVIFCGGEPFVTFEAIYDAAGLAMTAGLRNVLRTNGFASQDCLMELYRRIHAASCSLMAFSDTFYQEYCHGRLQPVLDALKAMRGLGWWLEISTPIIVELNDDTIEFRDMARFIREELGADTPWHLQRFLPAYRLHHHPETPRRRMEICRDIAREEGLHFVYLDDANEGLVCPGCGTKFSWRGPYARRSQINGICTCGYHLPGIWN